MYTWQGVDSANASPNATGESLPRRDAAWRYFQQLRNFTCPQKRIEHACESAVGPVAMLAHTFLPTPSPHPTAGTRTQHCRLHTLVCKASNRKRSYWSAPAMPRQQRDERADCLGSKL
jgi:hypothetical protein